MILPDGASFAHVDWSNLYGLVSLVAIVPAYRGFLLMRAFLRS